MAIQQQFRIHLDLDWRADPVIDCILTGETLEELITKAKNYAGELAAYTGATGIKSINLVNGHEILGFFKIPI